MPTKKLILTGVAIVALFIVVILGFGMLMNFMFHELGVKVTAIITFSLFFLCIVSAFIYDIKAKKKSEKEKSDFLTIGNFIFKQYKTDFTAFYNLYLRDKKKFLAENADGEFDLKTLKPFDVLYLFADAKKQVHLIDWRGEEDEKEIEIFIEDSFLKSEHSWTKTSKLRATVNGSDQRDGEFIVDLLKSVDKDLRTIKQRLLFFNLGWDAYVYTVLDDKTVGEAIRKYPDAFHGAGELKK